MSELSPDLEQYVQQKVASGRFASREEFALEAMRVYRELEARHESLKADVQAAVEQSEKRQSQPLDIDGIKKDYVSPPDEVLARIRADQAAAAEARKADRPETDFDSGFAWPALGPISGVYGSQRVLNGQPKRPHFGIDIAAPEGSAVLATDSGFVSFAGWTDVGYGNIIVMDHRNGYATYYAHLSNIYVFEGQVVERGDVVGAVGSTGWSTGPHLHFEIRFWGVQQNPRAHLP